jgi:hypothetical protein
MFMFHSLLILESWHVTPSISVEEWRRYSCTLESKAADFCTRLYQLPDYTVLHSRDYRTPITLMTSCPTDLFCSTFWARSQNCEKATNIFVTFVCLSVRMEKLGSHPTDFHEILYLSISRKSVENTPV